MTILVKKDALAATVTGDLDELDPKDRLDLIHAEYRTAKATEPNFDAVIAEINSYVVELPHTPDLADLSKINKLYAIAQSFSSRVTALEVGSLDNHSRWKRLSYLMEEYVEDCKDELLISEEVKDLTNLKAEAYVRTKLKKEYAGLRRIKDKLTQAEHFCRMVEAKKKDLSSVLTTLGKQVKALSLEHTSIR